MNKLKSLYRLLLSFIDFSFWSSLIFFNETFRIRVCSEANHFVNLSRGFKTKNHVLRLFFTVGDCNAHITLLRHTIGIGDILILG